MIDEPPTPGRTQRGTRIGRRGFIGAGLAGAGVALVLPRAGIATADTAAPASPDVAGAKSGASQIPHIPGLWLLYPNVPAIPVDVAEAIETIARLALRSQQTTQAKQGLTETFTINGKTAVAYEFLFGGSAGSLEGGAGAALAKFLEDHPDEVLSELFVKPLRTKRPVQFGPPGVGAAPPLSLDKPEQFSISWTTFPDVFREAQPLLPLWASSLRDPETATRQFWPTIAEHGFAYNLIIPEKVSAAKTARARRHFDAVWSAELEALAASESLYMIDMSVFQALQPQTVNGATRFTPSTVTLLTQDARTKALAPIAVTVTGYQGRGRQLFTRANSKDGAWLYALQAAKASITVFGVWLGHVYHWHLVTAAMQMTMLNTLPADHPLSLLLAPQSKFAIGFDDVLLLLWSRIAPPTSVSTWIQFIELINHFADGRTYFDDDPKVTLERHGLVAADFTVKTPWDQYPVVQRLLAIWDLVERYVNTCVEATYSSDAGVAADDALQKWIAMASAADQGNVRGLPKVNSRATLESVLTSLLYRISVHGISRLNSTANPALTFTANFPHCLQRSEIPKPSATIDTTTLLTYLPNTETISEAVNFYFTFVFSPPYEQFIPLGGVDSELFFPDAKDPRNQALIELRNGLAAFIDGYQPGTPQRFQWPRNIET
jgi:Lipoxygenase